MNLNSSCASFGVSIPFIVWLLTSVLGSVLPSMGATSESVKMRMYVGTYTGAKSKGIYEMELNRKTGELTAPKLVAETKSPSFLVVSPKKNFLYAVNEVADFQGKKSGAVTAYAIDKATGNLTFLNQQSTLGDGPCHVIMDRGGRHVLVANYGGGSVAVYPVDKKGFLGKPTAFVQHSGSSVNPRRQEGPHAHGIYLDKGDRFAFVPDLGLDKVMIYKFHDKKGTLIANDPPFAAIKPGSGPRHFTFELSGKFAYVINEMVCTVTAFRYDKKKGALEELQTISTLPEGVEVLPAYSTAEIHAHPNGKFIYGSNRGHDTIAVFAVDQDSGQLQLVQHVSTGGKTPRNFSIDPCGLYLWAANQSSDSIVMFRIDSKTGRLEPTGQSVSVPSPVCIAF